MLISEGLLKNLIIHLKTANIFESIPFTFNEADKCMELKSAKKLYIHKVRLMIAYSYLTLVWIQIVWTLDQADTFVKLHTFCNFTGLIMVCYTHHVFYSRVDEIVAFLNGMLKFEILRNEHSWHSENKGALVATKLYMKVMEVTMVFMPVVYQADLIRNPCMPIHLFGFKLVTEQCHGTIGSHLEATWSLEEVLQKVVIVGVNYFNWSFLVSGCAFHLSLGLFVKSYCIRSYILMAGELTNLKRKSSSSKMIFHVCRVFREIQIFGIEFRAIYSKYMTGTVLTMFSMMHCVSMYACIRHGLNLPLSMLILFVMIGVDGGMTILIVYTSLASVFKASMFLLGRQFSRCCTNVRNTETSRWFDKFLKSCQIVKVYVGDINFVEELTPLTVENFVLNQTVSLILME